LATIPLEKGLLGTRRHVKYLLVTPTHLAGAPSIKSQEEVYAQYLFYVDLKNSNSATIESLSDRDLDKYMTAKWASLSQAERTNYADKAKAVVEQGISAFDGEAIFNFLNRSTLHA